MKKAVLGLGVLMAVSIVLPSVVSADEALFKEKKCVKCHSIDSKGIASTNKKADKVVDISKAAEAGDAAWMTKWLKKEVEREVDGKMKKHKKDFKGSDEELKKMVDFMLTLK